MPNRAEIVSTVRTDPFMNEMEYSRFRTSTRVFAFALFAMLVCRPSSAVEPEIVGSVQFSNQVVQALALLRDRDTNAYSIVTNFVGRIQEAESGGMVANATPPTFMLSIAAATSSITWCASVIAHDSFHSKLYHDYKRSIPVSFDSRLYPDIPKYPVEVPSDAWVGLEAEQKCMAHQIQVMERIGAPVLELGHAKQNADGHYVTNSGWYYMSDVERMRVAVGGAAPTVEKSENGSSHVLTALACLGVAVCVYKWISYNREGVGPHH